MLRRLIQPLITSRSSLLNPRTRTGELGSTELNTPAITLVAPLGITAYLRLCFSATADPSRNG
jgi:hypothetical protein